MTTSGPVEKELAALQEFLAVTDTPDFRNDTGVASLRSAATKWQRHLRRPIRILVAGGEGTGDLALAIALAEHQFLAPDAMAEDYPPFVFTYGQKIAAAPGWWGKRVEKKYLKIDLELLSEANPDFIILQVPNPLLRQINVLCVPRLDGPVHARRLKKIAESSDMLLWRTNADHAWEEPEKLAWQALPASIRKHGVMALTNVDLPAVQQDSKEITAQLFEKVKPGFVSIFPLKVSATSNSGWAHDSDEWKNSGGKALVTGVLQVAGNIRKNEARKARVTIDRHFAPYLDLNSNDKPAKVEGDSPMTDRVPDSEASGDDVADAPAQPAKGGHETVADHPILATWQKKISGLLALLEKAEDIETSGFLATSSNIVVEMADAISEPGVLDKETEWLLPQYLDAVDLLILLELENGDEPIVEAINVLLQLSRDLSWIASRS